MPPLQYTWIGLLQECRSIKKSVSGFVEWQPKVKKIEETWLGRIAAVFAQNGFLPIETAAVEYLATLQTKGEIDKEIYTLGKLGSEVSKDLALHFDLTIPLARYVTEHFGRLAFPFKRYQIQKVWRGERPQFGRYREFYQADLDVIDSESLAGFYDAQVLTVGVEAMLKLNIAPFHVGVSNRKIYEGYLLGLGISQPALVLRSIDKLAKISYEGVLKVLVDTLGMNSKLAEKATALACVKLSGQTPSDAVSALGVKHDLLALGLKELEGLLANVKMLSSPQVVEIIQADLSFVRGFDYYTGSIFEGQFSDGSGYGSICSGGRYENLAEGFGSRKLPGVGFSIGVTRILAKESVEPEKMPDYPKSLFDFCLVLDGDMGDPRRLIESGNQLKSAGFSVNMVSVAKLKKGLQLAARTEAQVALFLFDGKIVLKHLGSGQQIEVENGSILAPAEKLIRT
ncbi:MAG: histidine--tRNA ligase [Bdellovibrionales bacterium]